MTVNHFVYAKFKEIVGSRRWRGWLAIFVFLGTQSQAGDSPSTTAFNSKLKLSQAESDIWVADVGNGLRKETHEIEFSVGAGFGLKDVAGRENHDIGIAMFRYGWTMSGLLGAEHWYRGNLELVGELFLGGQYNPRAAYVVGATPLFRYNFATGSRWLPFAEAGFGPTVTDIGEPDLSSKFEFNIQAGVGSHYFWNDRQAITMQARFMHISNAGFERPNIGVNSGLFMIGTSWFF
jgi:lipid A 3-O-deacylase